MSTSTHSDPLKLRALYDWTLSWAERPSALGALMALSFAESSFFPIPPDVLLLPLCLSRPKRWYLIAAYCTLFSVLGGLFGVWHWFPWLGSCRRRLLSVCSRVLAGKVRQSAGSV